MKRGKIINLRDKKAQMTWEQIVGLIVIIVLGILLIMFLNGSLGRVIGGLGFLPNDLNTATAACKQYASSDALAISFCEYRLLNINNVKQYVNCPYIHTQAVNALGADKVDFDKDKFACPQTPEDKCRELNKAKTTVSGVKCDSIIGDGTCTGEIGVCDIFDNDEAGCKNSEENHPDV